MLDVIHALLRNLQIYEAGWVRDDDYDGFKARVRGVRLTLQKIFRRGDFIDWRRV